MGPPTRTNPKEHAVKKDIHPEYVATTVTCTCGNTFETRSTAADGAIRDTGGRVARFQARYGKKADAKNA
jgi:large subunit ribosomal protein L31